MRYAWLSAPVSVQSYPIVPVKVKTPPLLISPSHCLPDRSKPVLCAEANALQNTIAFCASKRSLVFPHATPEKKLSAFELFLKRFMDIVIAGIGVIVAAVPMLIIALLIKLTSPGPVFYKQVRLTKDKKEFNIYKFRTMIPDAEKLSGPKFAEKDDPRITPIGKILRACRLDELPQILNILKGDMSVVGPRPERPVFVEQFEKEIEDYNYRFEVKAGLTSLSHVYGRYSTYIHDRTYYDLFYITHYSLFLDLKIILLTTKTMLLKSAAEGEDDFKEKTVAQPKDGAEV